MYNIRTITFHSALQWHHCDGYKTLLETLLKALFTQPTKKLQSFLVLFSAKTSLFCMNSVLSIVCSSSTSFSSHTFLFYLYLLVCSTTHPYCSMFRFYFDCLFLISHPLSSCSIIHLGTLYLINFFIFVLIDLRIQLKNVASDY